MPEYKEQPVGGIKWQRTRRIVIDTPAGEVPTISIQEEVAMFDGSDILTKALGTTITSPFDPVETFLLRHPETDELLGSSDTQAALYTLIYSWVRHKQIERDNANS